MMSKPRMMAGKTWGVKGVEGLEKGRGQERRGEAASGCGVWRGATEWRQNCEKNN
jgi:hypothetical protein